jgi:hypothetical protein
VSFITAALGAKRLGLLQELLPWAELVALVVNRTSEGTDQSQDVQEAARHDESLSRPLLRMGSSISPLQPLFNRRRMRS